MAIFDTLMASTASDDEIARALALAGAMEAAGTRNADGGAALEADQNAIPWDMPGDVSETVLGALSVEEMARLWDDLTEDWSHDPARLLWDAARYADQSEAVATQAWPIFAKCDSRKKSAPIVFMVVLDTTANDFSWSWPPFYAVSGAVADALTRDVGSMVARGLARVLSDDDGRYAPDFRVFNTWPADPVDEHGFYHIPEHHGLGLLLRQDDYTADPVGYLERVCAATRASGRPMAALPATADAEMDVVRTLTYELTHDLAPDTALVRYFDVFAPAGTMEFPVVIAGTIEQLPFGLEQARARNHVLRVLESLNPVPPTEPVPDDLLSPSILFRAVPRTIAGLRSALRRVTSRPEDYFHNESDAASTIEKLLEVSNSIAKDLLGGRELQSDFTQLFSLGRPAAYGAPELEYSPLASPPRSGLADEYVLPYESDPAAEADRFLDVSLYPGTGFGEFALETDAVLQSYATYSVGLAIRANRVGIDSDIALPPIQAPREGRETVKLWAVLSTPTPDLVDIQDPIAEIVWPFDSDTLEVFIPVIAKESVPGRYAEVEIRLYSDGLNYLDQVHIRGIAIGARSNLNLFRPDRAPAELNADNLGRQVDLQLHEEALGGGTRITMLAHPSDGSEKIQLLQRIIPANDAIRTLTLTREHMENLAKGIFKKREGVHEITLDTHMLPELATMGALAWRSLFGAHDSGLGKLIAQMDEQPGLTIQVTTSSPSGGFVFPWALLRPPLGFDETPEWDAFWGLRHEVEIWPGSFRRAGLEAAPISVATAEDDKFTELATHRTKLEALAHESGVTLEPAAVDRRALYSRLSEEPAHLYYFFCHGFAPSPFQLPRSVRNSLEQSGQILEGDNLEAKISFSGGELTESELDMLPAYQRRRPMFFLNMCQSAELAPGQSGGLVRVLLQRGAAAVLGTEAEMTAVFASSFAEDVLAQMFDGKPIGQAVLEARKLALGRGNPLGLAYSLYGRGDMRLGPNSTPEETENA